MNTADNISEIINNANSVVIVQADNPDADSLATSLALEQILHELGKEPYLYCAIDMPEYLKYLPGWDRVDKELPNQFDVCIVVDTSTLSLLERLEQSGKLSTLRSKPLIVLDHHAEVGNEIDFAEVVINDTKSVSTGEVLYNLAKSLSWPMNITALSHIMTSILADSMGLTTENTSSNTYRVMAELIDSGVSRPILEEQRRVFNKMPLEIFKYKAELIDRTEIHNNNIALVVIPQSEIIEFSPLYNPAPLIQPDHLQTKDILVSIVLKSYDNGRITAAIRCNLGAPVAATIAKKFNGGGHEYAAGFKIQDGKSLDQVKQECINTTIEYLNALEINTREKL